MLCACLLIIQYPTMAGRRNQRHKNNGSTPKTNRAVGVSFSSQCACGNHLLYAFSFLLKCSDFNTRGEFPVMAKLTRILAANIPRQLFFVIITTASTRCLVQNFRLICYSQRVNATSQYNGRGRTIGWLQWWNIAGSSYKEEERGCTER